MTNHTNDEQPKTTESPCSWPEFGRVSKIQGWIKELRKIKESQPTASDWCLIGRAVVVCHPIEELRAPLVQKVAYEAGYDYVALSGEEFFKWVHEEKAVQYDKPVLIHVAQHVWSRKIEDDKKAAEELVDFQTNDVPKYLANLPADQAVVFVVTGESYADLVPQLRSVGAFDRRFDVAEFTMEEIGAWFLGVVGSDLCDDSLLLDLGKIGKLVNDEFDDRRRQRLIALHLQRRAHRECRKLSFDDLVYFAVHSGSETEHAPEESDAMLRRIAVHEAGHALVSIIDSHNRNIPDYASIMPGSHFKGVVTDSYAYAFALSGRYTYEDSRHKIRVYLAGRIAEAIVFGATRVGTFTARSDLRNATAWTKELVGMYGFSAEQENPDAIRNNLAVIDDEASASEAAHIEQQTRLFLKRQYEAVEKMFIENREFLDSITHALLEKRVLNRSDLLAIWQGTPKNARRAPLDESLN